MLEQLSYALNLLTYSGFFLYSQPHEILIGLVVPQGFSCFYLQVCSSRWETHLSSEIGIVFQVCISKSSIYEKVTLQVNTSNT